MTIEFIISETPLNIPALTKKVENPRAGAIATFQGVTRNHNESRRVTCLEYEAYESMAEKIMRKIHDQAMKLSPFLGMIVAHRVGKVSVGEAGVFIAVSSEHRREAFAACQYATDRLKAELPIWKKEFFDDNQTDWIANKESIGTKT